MVTLYLFSVELFIVPDRNGRVLEIAGWENMGMGFKFLLVFHSNYVHILYRF